MQLTDTHLVLLSAAAQRDDRLLTQPASLRGLAAAKLAGKLEAAGLIEAARVDADQPHWRSDADGALFGFRLLRAGFDAIGIEPNEHAAEPATEAPCEEAPRRISKRALLIAMLGREDGASLEAIMHAMKWLPHSTRAALTGLRKAGHQLSRSKDEAGRTIYSLVESEAMSGLPADANTAAQHR